MSQNSQKDLLVHVDSKLKTCIQNSLKVSNLEESKYNTAILIGGRGCLTDFDNNESLNTLLHHICTFKHYHETNFTKLSFYLGFKEKGIIGALGHAALALATIGSFNSTPFIRYASIACKPDAEEERLDVARSVERKLRESNFHLSLKPPNVDNTLISNRRLVTAQNFASAKSFIECLTLALAIK